MMRFSTLLLSLTIGTYCLSGHDSVVAQPVAKPNPAAERATESAFKAGVAFLDKENYPQALVQFQKALKVAPNEPAILWNAGSAAFSSRNYKLAANYFERNLKYEPQNGHLLAKLVQTYQALGNITRRNTYRGKVFAMHRSGKDVSGYTKRDKYCRDQFTVNGDNVLAFESFELRPRSTQEDGYYFGMRYEFYVTAPKQERPKMRLEVGWNALDPDGKGGFRPAIEMTAFYFDAYYPTGAYSRKTYGLFSQELPYETVKARLIGILNGKIDATSAKRRGEPGT